ncbi:hypothetical protein ED733_002554 [Metarhizium rileyi]|uniref:V-SNARE coiled-coil homology domain-containing protein n=1 Tax=Metarhizium rileyi (strain RCEF 4871) TaxID=1649241 RepID=A0A5C6GDS6_METRR|nr:hypothetical protein ED733_002554 [Metarhizium rileyi]
MSDKLSYGQGGPYSSDDVPSSNSRNARSAQDDQIQNIKNGLEDAHKKMADNVEEITKRGARLDHLQDQTTTLADSSQQFRRGANKVRKQMWWKDMKMRMCLIGGIIILLLVIIIPSVVATRH